MASYGYQYDTSARKIDSFLKSPRKSPKKAKKKNKIKNSIQIKSKKYQEKVKVLEAKVARTNFAILMVITLGSILLLMYRNVQIRESFSKVQTLSKSVSMLEKENSQILVNIQNNLNLSNIENIAMSTLGMQKLSSKQTVYINLDTKDYTEISQNSTNVEKKNNVFIKIWNKIIDFF